MQKRMKIVAVCSDEDYPIITTDDMIMRETFIEFDDDETAMDVTIEFNFQETSVAMYYVNSNNHS